MVDFKALFAEFPRDLVSWRPQGSVSKNNTIMALAYIDARDVMDRLDAVCGPENWQDRYFETAKGRVICAIRIKVGDDWVEKCDGAGDTQVEGEKGAISDAFKRAAVKWGIGRYLYDLESPWVPCETYQGNDGKLKFRKFKGDPWASVRRAPRVMELPSEPSDTPVESAAPSKLSEQAKAIGPRAHGGLNTSPAEQAIAWLKSSTSADECVARWRKLLEQKPDVAAIEDVAAAYNETFDKFDPFPGDAPTEDAA